MRMKNRKRTGKQRKAREKGGQRKRRRKRREERPHKDGDEIGEERSRSSK